MIRLLTLLAIITINCNGFAQTSNEKDANTIIGLNIFTPGIKIEQQLAKSTTIIADFWTEYNFEFAVSNDITTTDFEMTYGVGLEPRFYTTLEKRKRKGRRTDYFSGGYIGIPFNYTFKSEDISGGVVYGFQSTLWKKMYINASGGLGVLKSKTEDTTAFPMMTFVFGYILN